ncbi:MAG: radical SAM family heme chaperone HemW [Pseudomonadales bacterium]|nr:radical SAM family heme chaperone HemW [Pseudomonadales bacterium]
MMQLPVALYIHVPWCIKKCPYCDFNSHAAHGSLPETEYLAALLRDLDAELDWFGRRPSIHAIFIGGGTPSLVSADFYQRLFAALRERLALPDSIEVTLEANPGTIDTANFAGFAEAGINRLSIGAQSFHEDALARLGRVHSSEEARRAFAIAREAGFENINIDLMHGLPGQTLLQACEDLEQAMQLGAEHISWYQLTIEPNTQFFNAPPQLPVEDTLAQIQDAGAARLASGSFEQYEVSAFARQKKYSQHNLNYWHFGDYIGIGAGAHAKLSREDGIYRRWKTRMPEHYMHAVQPLAGQKKLTAQELPVEYMLNALRLKRGFSLNDYTQRTGQPVASVENTIDTLYEKKLLLRQGSQVLTSELGWRFLNEVVEAFLPPDTRQIT